MSNHLTGRVGSVDITEDINNNGNGKNGREGPGEEGKRGRKARSVCKGFNFPNMEFMWGGNLSIICDSIPEGGSTVIDWPQALFIQRPVNKDGFVFHAKCCIENFMDTDNRVGKSGVCLKCAAFFDTWVMRKSREAAAGIAETIQTGEFQYNFTNLRCQLDMLPKSELINCLENLLSNELYTESDSGDECCSGSSSDIEMGPAVDVEESSTAEAFVALNDSVELIHLDVPEVVYDFILTDEMVLGLDCNLVPEDNMDADQESEKEMDDYLDVDEMIESFDCEYDHFVANPVGRKNVVITLSQPSLKGLEELRQSRSNNTENLENNASSSVDEVAEGDCKRRRTYRKADSAVLEKLQKIYAKFQVELCEFLDGMNTDTQLQVPRDVRANIDFSIDHATRSGQMIRGIASPNSVLRPFTHELSQKVLVLAGGNTTMDKIAKLIPGLACHQTTKKGIQSHRSRGINYLGLGKLFALMKPRVEQAFANGENIEILKQVHMSADATNIKYNVRTKPGEGRISMKSLTESYKHYKAKNEIKGSVVEADIPKAFELLLIEFVGLGLKCQAILSSWAVGDMCGSTVAVELMHAEIALAILGWNPIGIAVDGAPYNVLALDKNLYTDTACIVNCPGMHENEQECKAMNVKINRYQPFFENGCPNIAICNHDDEHVKKRAVAAHHKLGDKKDESGIHLFDLENTRSDYKGQYVSIPKLRTYYSEFLQQGRVRSISKFITLEVFDFLLGKSYHRMISLNALKFFSKEFSHCLQLMRCWIEYTNKEHKYIVDKQTDEDVIEMVNVLSPHCLHCQMVVDLSQYWEYWKTGKASYQQKSRFLDYTSDKIQSALCGAAYFQKQCDRARSAGVPTYHPSPRDRWLRYVHTIVFQIRYFSACAFPGFCLPVNQCTSGKNEMAHSAAKRLIPVGDLTAEAMEFAVTAVQMNMCNDYENGVNGIASNNRDSNSNKGNCRTGVGKERPRKKAQVQNPELVLTHRIKTAYVKEQKNAGNENERMNNK